MAFVLNKQKLSGTGYEPREEKAIHEVISWGRLPGHNEIFAFFNTSLEAFRSAAEALMGRFRSVLPQGCLRARIRQTKRGDAKEGFLSDTLGDESHGFVVVDSSGAPMKYSMLKSMRDICAKQWSRLEVDVPGPRGKGWRRTNSYLDTREMDESWRRDMDVGCEHVMEESFVHGHDVHLDAKIWPAVHPYGSGSVFSELASGGLVNHCQNRLLLLQSWFRKSPLWAFWMLNRKIKHKLFFANLSRCRAGRKDHGGATADADAETRLFGTVPLFSLAVSGSER